MIRVFTDDSQVIPVGVDCLRFVSYGHIFYAYGMVVVQAFNGAGDTVTPTYINLFCYRLFQIPIAYSLANLAGMEGGIPGDHDLRIHDRCRGDAAVPPGPMEEPHDLMCRPAEGVSHGQAGLVL